ncbi:MAG: molybdopterin-binding protein [Pseudomonadota bacterium]
MRFGSVPVRQAQGALLAHSVALPSRRLRKGVALEVQDLDDLAAAGIHEVVVAQLDEGDVDENEAARRLARALIGGAQGISLTKAFTGRVNIVAAEPGIARIDAGAIDAVNGCDPMITCATVPPLARLEAGNLIATIKIISYAVSESALSKAERFAAHVDVAVGLHPVQVRTARLIVTETAAAPSSEKGIAATRARLERLGMSLAAVTQVPHQATEIARALSETSEDLCLILTASATSDAFDVAPEGLRHVGGRVIRFGMPVDPGNLLFLGTHAGRPVIGLPGCARAPALNGADFVLERMACGLEVTDADIAGMGVGGLLKEIPQRPQPRRGPEKT